jgi:tRNA 2-thiouridine synthesizing protein B
MSTLHTVNKSSFTHTTLLSCLQICDDNDDILLLEDGVFGAITSSPYAELLSSTPLRGVKIFAISNDIKARGLQEKLHVNIIITDYNGFVELSIKHQRIQSWY